MKFHIYIYVIYNIYITSYHIFIFVVVALFVQEENCPPRGRLYHAKLALIG